MIKMTKWEGCYKETWKGLIVSDEPNIGEQLDFLPSKKYSAYEHPAKISRALARRIYEHLRDVYVLLPGAVCLDPFGGVGCLGLDALLMGYHYLAVELEPRFVALAHANQVYWQHRFGPQPGSVTVVQGDSRALRTVLGATQLDCLLSSPVYAGAGEILGTHNGIDYSKGKNTGQYRTPGRMNIETVYGQTEGQLGALPTGELTVLSSPSYGGNEKHDYRVRDANGLDRDERRGKLQGQGSFRGSETYGQTEGQLGAMPTGCLMSSPPYGDQQVGSGQSGRTGWRGYTDIGGGTAAREGQLSALPTMCNDEAKPTFWSESSRCMAEISAILAPGALAVWIVKAYVRDKTVVPFPDQWEQLCTMHGFRTVERITASLIEHHGYEETLWGARLAKTTERKGHFRRQNEKKGAPRIDEEIVLIMQRQG